MPLLENERCAAYLGWKHKTGVAIIRQMTRYHGLGVAWA